MDVARFTLPAARLSDAETLVARFARKAAKLGLAAPSMEVAHTFTRYWIVTGKGDVKAGPFDGALPVVYVADRVNVVSADFVDVDVYGTRPVISGWQFAAVIEATANGNILRKAPGFEGDLPKCFRDCDSACDHCRTNRDRAHTFVVHSVDSGEWKQVGRSCLQDFTANADAEAWMAAFTFARSMEALGSEDGEGGFGGAKPYVDVPAFLACVAAQVREIGYMSAKAAGSWLPPKMSTGKEVFFGLTDRDPATRRIYADAVTDDDRQLARDAVAWIKSDDAGDSDYIHNVRMYASGDAVDSRGANTLASLIATYRRHLGKQAAKAAKLNEHLPGATVKKRLRDLVLTQVAEHSFNTAYGTKWILRFEDAQGRTVVWKTTSPGEGYKVGDKVLVTGTVKDLGEYKGTLQTELSRCKVTKLEREGAAA